MQSSVAQLEGITHTLSSPGKIPCHGFSIPARFCKTGSRLRGIPGSVCYECYARKGYYVQTHVQRCLERRFVSLCHPDFVPAIAALITKREPSGCFRWHDSGDLQGEWHLRQIAQVCKLTPNIRHWMPTREWKMVQKYREIFGPLPGNLTTRLSALMVDQAPPVELAKDLGVQVSGVSRSGYSCLAPNQDGKCRSCRACWNKEVFNITYKLH